MSAVPSEMTAAVLHAPGDLRVETVPVPAPGPGDVLVKVGGCGICGSDVPRVLKTGTYRLPLIPGHEFAGTVAALGDGVDDWTEGDRVTVFPLLPCGKCQWCDLRTYEVCEDYDYLGSRRDGAFAQYVTAPAWNLVRVPESVALRDAAMTEPAACALHTVRRGDVGEGDVVAVLGAGPIGLMVAQWARALGARRVVVADIVDEKLVLARRLGFDDTCNVREESLSARVAEVTGGEGARVVVEAAGVAEAVLQSIEIVQPLGIIVLMGNPTQTVVMPPAALSEVLRKQATIRGTWNSTFKGRDADDWQDALGAMADGRIEVAAVVTHEFRIGEANEAFRMMASGEEFYTKVMLSFE